MIDIDIKMNAELGEVLTILRRLDRKLNTVLAKGEDMTQELDALTREVSEARTVNESAVAMIGGLAQQIRDLSDDPAALAALASDLDAQSNALAAAITANTPTDPDTGTPVEDPTPPVEEPTNPNG